MLFEVIERGTNRELIYELLLLVYSNFRRITHRFRDTNGFNADNHIFAYPYLYRTLNLKVMLLEYGDEIWQQKTRIMGLPYGEKIMIIGRTVDTVHECARQTEGRTDGRTDRQTDLR